jgi:hypothetical protein
MSAVTGYETEQANLITIGNAVSSLMGPAFLNAAQGLPLVVAEPFPDITNTIKVPISGSLTAATLSESNAYSFSSSSELTDTSVTCTAKKVVSGSRPTVEALRFSQPWANPARIANNMGAAIGRVFDSDFVALFSSTTNSVIATSTLVKDNLLDARYNVESSMLGAFSGQLVGMLHPKGLNEVRKDITNTGATAFGNLGLLGIVGQVQPGKQFAGNLMGIDLYYRTGLPTTGGDNIQQVWDPKNAFYAGVDGISGFRTSIQEPTAENGLVVSYLAWTFFKIIQWRDTAACIVRSDS